MSETMDKTIAVPVEVVCMSGDIPFIAEGRISSFVDGTYIIDLDRNTTGLRSGAAAILNFLDDGTPRVIARVAETRGNQLICTQQQVREREKRAFPRLHGGLPVRYRVLTKEEASTESARWLSGDDGPLERGSWHSPDEFMNFSVAGLRFDTPRTAEEDELLLVELGVRGRSERWHCTARVVRLFVIPNDEQDPDDGMTHRLAVNFEHIPEDAQEALTEMTLDIQEALL
jgi:hypothetical protein